MVEKKLTRATINLRDIFQYLLIWKDNKLFHEDDSRVNHNLPPAEVDEQE